MGKNHMRCRACNTKVRTGPNKASEGKSLTQAIHQDGIVMVPETTMVLGAGPPIRLRLRVLILASNKSAQVFGCAPLGSSAFSCTLKAWLPVSETTLKSDTGRPDNLTTRHTRAFLRSTKGARATPSNLSQQDTIRSCATFQRETRVCRSGAQQRVLPDAPKYQLICLPQAGSQWKACTLDPQKQIKSADASR